MIRFTDDQRRAALVVVHRYQRERDIRVSDNQLQKDQLGFMRFCNEKAREFESASAPMSFAELAEMHIAFKEVNRGGAPWGIDFSQWSDLAMFEQIAIEELTGCLLGLRRMGRENG